MIHRHCKKILHQLDIDQTLTNQDRRERFIPKSRKYLGSWFLSTCFTHWDYRGIIGSYVPLKYYEKYVDPLCYE